MAFQLRRGTNAQRLGLTPLQGELLYTTDTKTLYVGDGTTAGGTSVGGGGGATDLNDLTDVVITGGTLASGQVLKYNGTNWVNGTDSTGGGGGAVDSVNGEVGDVVLTTTDIAEGTNEYYTQQKAQDAVASLFDNGTHSGITFVYDDLTNSIDATVTGGGGGGTTENEVLDWVGPMLANGTNTGITFTYNAGTNGLTSAVSVGVSDLSDVTIVGTPAEGEILRYNATLDVWVNDVLELLSDPAPTLGGLLDLNNNTITGTGNIDIDGTAIISGNVDIGSDASGYLGTLGVTNGTNVVGANSMFSLTSIGAANVLPTTDLFKARGTVAAPTAVQPTDLLHAIRFIGRGTAAGAQIPTSSVQIVGLADGSGTIGTNFAPGFFGIQTRNDAGALNTVLSLNKDGVLRLWGGNAVDPTAVDEAGGAVSYLTVRITDPLNPTLFTTLYIPLLAAI